MMYETNIKINNLVKVSLLNCIQLRGVQKRTTKTPLVVCVFFTEGTLYKIPFLQCIYLMFSNVVDNR